MSEARPEWLEPCGHSEPQADSQLHGVCVFCYRDRCGKLAKQLAEREAELAKAYHDQQAAGHDLAEARAELARLREAATAAWADIETAVASKPNVDFGRGGRWISSLFIMLRRRSKKLSVALAATPQEPEGTG